MIRVLIIILPTAKSLYKKAAKSTLSAAKRWADGIFVELGVPATFLRASFYWDNFINFVMGPKKGPDGALAITFPWAAHGSQA